MFDLWVGKIPWRRERLPTPVFWPGEFHGLYNPCGHKESDRIEQLSLSLRGSLVVLTFCHKGGVICVSKVIDISPGSLDSSLCFIQLGILHDVFSI